MTYDPIDTNDDGVVDADVDNQSVSTESASIESPSIGTPPQQTSEGRLSREPVGVSQKTQILDSANLSWTGGKDIYWPSIVDAKAVFDNPLADYYCYYSLDHATSSPMGIGLAYTDDPLGSWTDYASNPVFDVHAEGDETPKAIYDPANSRLNLYYHSPNLGSNQSTGLATTPDSGDGTSFTDQGIVLDQIEGFGNNHTGYFRPHRIGGEWIGWSLASGGNYAKFAVWYSTDGVDWTPDMRPLTSSVDVTGDNDERVEWNTSNVRRWNGQLWWLGTVGPFVSGADQGTKNVSVAPITTERALARRPRTLVSPTESWEGNATYSPDWFVDKRASESYIAYASGGSIGVAKVDGGAL